MRWITGIGPNLKHEDDGTDITHLTYLTQIRSLMPTPAYRNEDEMLFGHVGLATGTDNEANAA